MRLLLLVAFSFVLLKAMNVAPLCRQATSYREAQEPRAVIAVTHFIAGSKLQL
eukprot:COSAG02_NODE_683_length_18518_cov_4.033172_8_plen_53_part_00